MHIIFHCHLFLITTHKPFFAVVFPFFLLSLMSLDVFKFYFPEISPAGLWHIAALTSPSTPAPAALSQSSPAAFLPPPSCSEQAQLRRLGHHSC